MRTPLLALTFVFVSLVAVSAPAQTPIPPRLVSQIGGTAESVVSQGGLLYWGQGPRLIIGRWTGTSIEVLGRSPVMPAIVRDVEVEGDAAYVTDGTGLQVVNVTDPSRPTLSGFVDTPGAAFEAVVGDGFVYVADGLLGVRVIDARDPDNPVEVRDLPVISGATGVAVNVTHLFVVDGRFGLRVFDRADPSDPVEVGNLAVDFLTGPIHVDGDFAYVAFDEGAVRDGGFIIDVSDPANPVQRGTYLAREPIRDVAVDGDRLYAVDGYGLWAFDISDPDNPGAPVDPVNPLSPREIRTPGEASALVLEFPIAFVADGTGGLRAFDVRYPRGMRGLAEHNPVGQPFGISVDGDLGVVAAAAHGLRFLDLTDPARPVPVGAIDPALDLEFAVALRGRTAYAAGSGNGNAGRSLYVIDAADPRRPVEVRSALMNTGGLGVAANDTNVFVGGGINGMQVVNITDPTLAVQQTYATSIAFAQSVAVEGDLAFLASWGGQFRWDAGLRIYDVSDLADPAALNVPLLSYVPTTGGEATDVAVEGGFAYVVDREGLKVIDATDPRNAAVVGSLDTPGDAAAVAVAGAVAYVLDGENLRAIDVADPRAPREFGAVPVPGETADVAVQGAYAYVTSLEGGLYVLQVASLPAVTPPEDPEDPAETPMPEAPADPIGGSRPGAPVPPRVAGAGGCGCQLEATTPELRIGDLSAMLLVSLAAFRFLRRSR